MADGEKIKQCLDLRGVRCPMNFVKTKLKLEEMPRDQLLEIILDDREAVHDLPLTLREQGHSVLQLQNEDGVFFLVVRKG